MTTDKQKASNKQNAKHSTGPKTDEGKQRSSQNALKHGIYAIESVIPGEDPADFDALCTEFGQRYDPDGPYERSLVRQMADAEWRMRRIMRLEADFLKSAVDDERKNQTRRFPNEPEPDLSLLRGHALQTRTMELQRFGRYEADLSRRQRQAHKSLMECRQQEAQRDALPSPTTRADRPRPRSPRPRPQRPARTLLPPRRRSPHSTQRGSTTNPDSPKPNKINHIRPTGPQYLRRTGSLTPRRSQGNQPTGAQIEINQPDKTCQAQSPTHTGHQTHVQPHRLMPEATEPRQLWSGLSTLTEPANPCHAAKPLVRATERCRQCNAATLTHPVRCSGSTRRIRDRASGLVCGHG